MILKSEQEYVPHAPGIFPAVCVDMIDLGIETTEFQGKQRQVPRVRLVFETMGDDGSRAIIGRSFTASLASKAKLAQFLGTWRGRPVLPGDTIDLNKLLGVSCTLVISHVQRNDGQGVYAGIDTITRPTKQVPQSGTYDPAAERQRIAERKAGMAGRDAFHRVPNSPAPAMAPAAGPAEEEGDDVPF
jgi:hypothetical protein